MKYLSKIFSILGVGLLMVACTDKIEEVNIPLNVTAPTVSSVSANSAYLQATAVGTGITTRGFCYGTQADDDLYGRRYHC